MKTMPKRRDVKVNFDANKIDSWHSDGRVTTHFLNTLSTMFPHGERFFMDSVRAHRHLVEDEALKQAIVAFIGQEAMHSREHLKYNSAIDSKGLPGTEIQEQTGRLIKFFANRLPKKAHLAATLALEHYTAILGELFLKNPDFAGIGSDPKFAQMWAWHAMEETEHKAVAYDVWQAAFQNNTENYIYRTGSMVMVSAIFLSALAYFHTKMVLADPKTKGQRLKGYYKLGKTLLFSKNGPNITTSLPMFADYFSKDFHPWMHDSPELTHDIDSKVERIKVKVA